MSLSNQSVCTREIKYILLTRGVQLGTERLLDDGGRDSEGDDRTVQHRGRVGEGRRTLLEAECGWLMVKTQAGADTKGKPRQM